MDEIIPSDIFSSGPSVTIEGYGSGSAPTGDISAPSFPSGGADAPAQFNNLFMAQLPTLSNVSQESIPGSDTANAAQQLLQQQQTISQASKDLLAQQPILQQDYATYQTAYNSNIGSYNDAMKKYTQQMRLVAVEPPGVLQQLAQNVAYKYYNQASAAAQSINDAATSYQTALDSYNTSVKNLQDQYTSYQNTYKSVTAGAPATSTAPTTGTTTASPTTPTTGAGSGGGGTGGGTGASGTGGPGIGDINIPTGQVNPTVSPTTPTTTPTPTPKTPTITPIAEPVTATPVEPVAPVTSKPVVEPAQEPYKISPQTDFSIPVEFNPIFPGSTSPTTTTLGKALGTTGGGSLGAVLGSGAAPNPDVMVGSSENPRPVWNQESLKSALGI